MKINGDFYVFFSHGMKFSENLRAWMDYKGETIDTLARSSGLSRSAVANILTGLSSSPRGTTKKKVAAALGIRPEDLSRAPLIHTKTNGNIRSLDELREEVLSFIEHGECSFEELETTLVELLQTIGIDKMKRMNRTQPS